jgi:hypothetical protein
MKVYNHALIWSTIYRYFPEIEPLLKPETINHAINAIALDSGLHVLFGAFRLAFDETVCLYGQ